MGDSSRNPMKSAVGRTYYKREADALAREWKRAGYTPSIYDSPTFTSNRTIYTIYVEEHVPNIPGGEFIITHPKKGAAISRSRNPVMPWGLRTVKTHPGDGAGYGKPASGNRAGGKGDSSMWPASPHTMTNPGPYSSSSHPGEGAGFSDITPPGRDLTTTDTEGLFGQQLRAGGIPSSTHLKNPHIKKAKSNPHAIEQARGTCPDCGSTILVNPSDSNVGCGNCGASLRVQR